jgi:hypothetical protein
MLFWNNNMLFTLRTFDGILTWFFLVCAVGFFVYNYSFEILDIQLLFMLLFGFVYLSIRIMIHTYRLSVVLYGTNSPYELIYVSFAFFTYPFLMAASIVKRVTDSRRISDVNTNNP